ncbi:hypothetical protein QN277_014536 [Acacia crassicarpa]|nr:hypothetical protein QN277_014536 [Acacia crassicarpa]
MGINKSLGLQSVIEAEIHTIMLGLKMGQQMGTRRVLLYSNLLDAVNLIMRDYCHADHPLRGIIMKTRDLLFQDWDVELHYTLRENNSCADYMAKQGDDAPIDADVVLFPMTPAGCTQRFLTDRGSCRS